MVMRKACCSFSQCILTTMLVAACAVPAAAKTVSTTTSKTALPAVSGQPMIRATGQGAMPSAAEEPNRARAYLKAKSYARMDAIANLVQAARGTAIRYRSTGRGYMSEEEVDQEIDGIVDSVQIVSERKQQEGKDTIVEVTVESPQPFPTAKRRLARVRRVPASGLPPRHLTLRGLLAVRRSAPPSPPECPTRGPRKRPIPRSLSTPWDSA